MCYDCEERFSVFSRLTCHYNIYSYIQKKKTIKKIYEKVYICDLFTNVLFFFLMGFVRFQIGVFIMKVCLSEDIF